MKWEEHQILMSPNLKYSNTLFLLLFRSHTLLRSNFTMVKIISQISPKIAPCLSYCDADMYVYMLCMYYLCWRVRFLWSRLLKQVLMNIINIIRSIVIHIKIMTVAPFIMPRHDLKASLWKIVWNCQ